MKIAALIARILMGLAFLVFGLNGFFNFIPQGPPPSGAAGEFLDAIVKSHFFMMVAAVQIIGGVLLLVNRFVPLALVILGPVIVNIFFFHLLMLPSGLPQAIVVVILWCVVAAAKLAIFVGDICARRAP